ncbi:hypothetical protein FR819_27250 (plasmid) [Leclercia adecarboxylata]|nr:hypothetical protein FR819_27250 [Leclercia adecarboxylata]
MMVRPRRATRAWAGGLTSSTGQSPGLSCGVSGRSGHSQVSSLITGMVLPGSSHWTTWRDSRAGSPGSRTSQTAVVTSWRVGASNDSSTPQASADARRSVA